MEILQINIEGLKLENKSLREEFAGRERVLVRQNQEKDERIMKLEDELRSFDFSRSD